MGCCLIFVFNFLKNFHLLLLLTIKYLLFSDNYNKKWVLILNIVNQFIMICAVKKIKKSTVFDK